MPAAAVALLGLGLAAIAALARPRLAFATIVAATILVPDSLALPTSISPVLTVHLVVTVAALAGLAWRTAEGVTPGSVWRPTGASIGLAAYLAVALVVGLAAAAPGVSVGAGALRALDLVQQLLVLIVCTALVREDGDPMRFVAPVAGVLLVSAGIGVVEHLTSASWGEYLFEHLPSQQGTPAASKLVARDGALRVRGGADFALSYAAVLAALLAMLVVALAKAAPWRKLLWLAGAAVVVLAIYWSGTRSVVAAFAVMLLGIGMLSGRLRLAIACAAVVVAGGIALFALAGVGQHFSIGVDAGSVAVRSQRLPVVLDAVAARPFTGVGLSGLSLLGVRAVDSSYLLVYGETGAIGIAALFAALVAAFASVGRGLWTRDRQQRVLIAGVLGGMLAIVVSAVALDAIDLPSVADVFWELTAIGVVAADVAYRPARLLRPAAAVLAATLSAAAIGGAAAIAAPVQGSVAYTFSTLPPLDDVGSGDLSLTGDLLISTACQAFAAGATQVPYRVSISCRDPFRAPGEGVLRVQAATPRKALIAAYTIVGAAKHAKSLHFLSLRATQGPSEGRPSGLVTLPASAAVAMLILALAVPLNRRERSAAPWPPARSRRRFARRTRPSRTPPLAAAPQT